MVLKSHFWVYDQKNWKQGLSAVFWTPIFIAAIFTTAKKWRQPRPKIHPSSWMDKLNALHSYSGILFHLKKGRRSYRMLQQGWTLGTLCWVKRASPIKTNSVGFHLHELCKVDKFTSSSVHTTWPQEAFLSLNIMFWHNWGLLLTVLGCV